MSSAVPALLRTTARAATLLGAVNGPVSRTGRNLAAVLVAAMVALTLAQILARVAFDYALDWAEELARATLVWSVLLVAPFAYRRGAHIGIDSFAVALPPRLALLVAFAINALVIWVCAVFLVESIAFFRRGLTLVSTTMGFPVAAIYSIVPVSFALLIAVGLELQLRLARSFAEPDPDLTLSGVVPGVKPAPHDE